MSLGEQNSIITTVSGVFEGVGIAITSLQILQASLKLHFMQPFLLLITIQIVLNVIQINSISTVFWRCLDFINRMTDSQQKALLLTLATLVTTDGGVLFLTGCT